MRPRPLLSKLDLLRAQYARSIFFCTAIAISASVPVAAQLNQELRFPAQNLALHAKPPVAANGIKSPLTVAGAAFATQAAPAQPVLTAEYTNGRTNANNYETYLNPARVGGGMFGKVGSWALDGQVIAQPLYVPGVVVGSSTVNALYVATMNNSVYALDADHPGSAPLWSVNLGPAVPQSYAGRCPAQWSIGSQLGILGTPVIDNASQTIYVVAANPIANQAAYGFTLYALDLSTGQQKLGGSKPIAASVKGTGDGAVNGVVAMSQSSLFQRPGLLLSAGNVYIGFGACGYGITPYHGWVIGYSAANIQKQTAVFNSTPNGSNGGVWQAGAGLSADTRGSIYLATGNGSTDEQTNFGESVVKLSPGGIVRDYFTPSDTTYLTAMDEDLSTTAPILTGDTNLAIFSGKQGLVYVLNAASLGGVGHYVQTFWGSTQCDPTSYNGCNNVHSLAYWRSTDEYRLYVWGAGDVLRTYGYSNGMFNPTPESQTTTTAAYPGGTLTVTSAWGMPSTGIVWALTPGVLHAYQATNVARELWNSNQNAARDGVPATYHLEQFTVANGRVYLPDTRGNIVVYGVLPPQAK